MNKPMVICSDLGILLSPRNKGILRQVQAWMSQQTSYGAKGARHTQKVHAVCEVKQRAIALRMGYLRRQQVWAIECERSQGKLLE